MDTPFQPFISAPEDREHATHIESGDSRLGVVPEQPIHPLITAIVLSARNPKTLSGLHLVKHTRLTAAPTHNGEVGSAKFSLSDGVYTVDLGHGDAAICAAVHVMGTAVDETVKACKDARIVELYKAYARTPEPEQVLDALWGIMTRGEQLDADANRAFGTLRGFTDSLEVVEGEEEEPE